MPFKKQLITALAIGALALPATTVSVWTLSATPAFAKSGNGNGKSGANRSSNRSTSKGNSSSRKPTRTSSQRGGNGNGKGNGNGNGSANRADKPVVAASAPNADATTELAPNQLGSMNGAMHANINAVLAHIRNGNTNGPVGALAGLAVADHNAAGAQDVIDQAAQHDALDSALAAAEYETLTDYQDAVAAGEIEPITDIEDAIAALGDSIDEDGPTDEEVADAIDALAAQEAAEGGILDAWNKSGEASDEEQDALLQALRDRLDAESGAISETIDSIEMASASDDGTGDDGTSDDDTSDDEADDDGSADDATADDEANADDPVTE